MNIDVLLMPPLGLQFLPALLPISYCYYTAGLLLLLLLLLPLLRLLLLCIFTDFSTNAYISMYIVRLFSLLIPVYLLLLLLFVELAHHFILLQLQHLSRQTPTVPLALLDQRLTDAPSRLFNVYADGSFLSC